MLIFPVDCFILLCFQNNPSACSWGDFGITLCKEHFTNLTRTNELVWMIPVGSFKLKMFHDLFKSLVKQLTSSIVWLFHSSMPWELLHEKKLFFVGAFFLFGLSFHSPSNVKPN